MAKFPPDSEKVLRAIAAGRMTWTVAFGEWIDNAFDRAATRVSFAFDRSHLTIIDDGDGTADPQNILVLGAHLTPRDGLGEYGFGGKESLLWAGGEQSTVKIVTTHGKKTRSLEANWQRYARSDWELPDVEETLAAPGAIGTTIVISPVQKRPPSDLDRVCDELGFLYSHAIRRDGKQITIKGPGRMRPRPIVAWTPPEFERTPTPLRESFEVNGKPVQVYVGVVKEGEANPRSGLTYWYRYRVIIPASSRGCGDANIGRVCGFVELGDGWKSTLTRNKNGFTVGSEELFEAVEQRIRPILDAAERAGSTLALRDLTLRVEGDVNTMLRDQRAKREPGSEHGTREPTETGPRHTQARNVQPGHTFASPRSGKVRIFYHLLGGKKLGEAKAPTVTLNLSNQRVKKAYQESDAGWLALAALSLIADWDSHGGTNGQRFLFGGDEEKHFNEQLGQMVDKDPQLDGGRPVLRVVGGE